MKTLLLTFFVILPLTVFADVVIEDPGPADFEDVDLNHDGAVDREEFRRRMIEVFYSMDDNRDGILSIQEWENIEEERAIHGDTDNNGELDLEEFLLETYYDFERADENDDGRLQEAETRPD